MSTTSQTTTTSGNDTRGAYVTAGKSFERDSAAWNGAANAA